MWLGLLTLSLIVVTALVLLLFHLTGVNGGERDLGIFEALWQSMLRVVDAGTFASDVNWPTRVLGLLITISGIFIAGSLIGLIANAVDLRIEELRRGRSNVLENDHSLILGWSDRVPVIVSELVQAHQSRKRAAVVVIADIDKTEMEDRLREAVPNPGTTRIVCRSGEPWNPPNLVMANLAGARSALVVANGDDNRSVKTLLAVRAVRPNDPAASSHLNVVAEIDHDATTQTVASLMPGVVTVSSDTVVAELTAQACRQRGLSAVFHELLDFAGDEIYFAPFAQLVGGTYAEAQLAFERAALFGVLHVDGSLHLGPPADMVLVAGDELVGVVEDDSVYLPAPQPVAGRRLPVETTRVEEVDRRIVIVGWSSLGPKVLRELDEFLDAHTTVELVLDPDLVDVEAIRAGLDTGHVSLELTALRGGPEAIAAHAARHAFHEVIVLGYRESLSADSADTRTLLTLVAFQHLREHHSASSVRVVAELLDQRNVALAEVTGADDFIVSEELTSLMLAQLSERGELGRVFGDLFDRDGCSIELRPSQRYGGALATCFADIVVTAISEGASAIGYRRGETGEVVLNPSKSAPLSLNAADEIVVVASAT